MGFTKKVVFSLIVAFLLVAAGEATARVSYWWRHGRDVYYLIAPWGERDKVPYGLKDFKGLKTYSARHPGTYTSFDENSGRELLCRINSQGGRGADWTLAKAPETLRILAIGDSSTFGLSNPEEATWPTFFEEELRRRYRLPIEVFNGGLLGGTLGTLPGLHGEELDLLRRLSGSSKPAKPGGRQEGWLAYRPDVVIYYAAYNNAPRSIGATAEWAITHFHGATRIGQLTQFLYYRSMFYTYLLEKYQIAARKAQRHQLVESLADFQLRVRALLTLLRDHDVMPVVVLQVLKYPEAAGLRQLDLSHRDHVEAFIEASTTTGPQESFPLQQDWRVVLNVQVLIEAARREADVAGAQVIDPRPAFFRVDEARTPYLYDRAHLTDEGNKLLAREIAERLDLSMFESRVRMH